MQKNTLASILWWLGLIPAGFFLGLWLLFGLGEVLGGDTSGLSHLIPAILMIILVLVSWRWPRAGGLAMLALGIIVAITLYSITPNPAGRMTGSLLTSGPFLVSGLLFFISGWLKKT